MQASGEPVRSWFHRPWVLAMLAAALSAAVLMLGSVGVAMHQVQQQESEQMNAQGQRFLERLEQLFGQLREGLDALEAQPLRECSADMITALQQVSYSYRFIYEAVYMDADQTCSNWPQQNLTPSPGRRISGAPPIATGSIPPPNPMKTSRRSCSAVATFALPLPVGT